MWRGLRSPNWGTYPNTVGASYGGPAVVSDRLAVMCSRRGSIVRRCQRKGQTLLLARQGWNRSVRQRLPEFQPRVLRSSGLCPGSCDGAGHVPPKSLRSGTGAGRCSSVIMYIIGTAADLLRSAGRPPAPAFAVSAPPPVTSPAPALSVPPTSPSVPVTSPAPVLPAPRPASPFVHQVGASACQAAAGASASGAQARCAARLFASSTARWRAPVRPSRGCLRDVLRVLFAIWTPPPG